MIGGVYGCVAWNLDLDASDQILPRGDAAKLSRVKPQTNQCRVGVAELLVNNLGVSLKIVELARRVLVSSSLTRTIRISTGKAPSSVIM